jgi:hypothetical protein
MDSRQTASPVDFKLSQYPIFIRTSTAEIAPICGPTFATPLLTLTLYEDDWCNIPISRIDRSISNTLVFSSSRKTGFAPSRPEPHSNSISSTCSTFGLSLGGAFNLELAFGTETKDGKGARKQWHGTKMAQRPST